MMHVGKDNRGTMWKYYESYLYFRQRGAICLLPHFFWNCWNS